MPYMHAMATVLLLCLSHVFVDGKVEDKLARHVRRADHLSGTSNGTNHLFEGNVGNNQNNLQNPKPMENESMHGKMKYDIDSSNFLVDTVSEFVRKLFGNITRHSTEPSESTPEEKPEEKPENNETFTMPVIDRRQKQNGNSERTKASKDTHTMLPKLHRKPPAKPADLGKLHIPRRRMSRPYNKLHVLPHTKKSTNVAIEA